MFRRLTLALIVMVCLGIGMPSIPVLNHITSPLIGVEPAQAQEKKKRKTLFDVLFKRRKDKKAAKETNRIKSIQRVKKKKKVRTLKKTTKSAARRKKKTTASRTKKRAPKVIIVKNENAAKILVVGDFLAGGMATELEKLYASNPNIVIINKSNPSSGIVRDDVVNWPEAIPALISEVKPIAIINLVGMNDRQKILNIAGKPDKRTEEWLTEYNSRLVKITSATTSNKVPLVWVGLPPVRSSSMNADYLAFNELYRTKIEASGAGEYVDIWDGFTNEEGKFVSAGPDINGQIVRLRGKKGINMTRAGRAKLAFFADKALRKLGIISNAEGFEFANLGTINLNGAQPNVQQYDPVGTGRTNVISLNSPALDGGNLLEGGKGDPAKDEQKESVSYQLVEKGENILPRVGRVDAGWGKPKALEIIKPEKFKDAKKTSNLSPANNNTPTAIKPAVAN